MVIGIDPDREKSGIAIIDNNELIIDNLSFFELFDFIKKNKDLIKSISIEAGWLNKPSNFHKGYFNKKGVYIKNSNNVNESIAKYVGTNHETGRKIVEMCEYLGIGYELIRPTKTKVNAGLFCAITGFKRSNQDQRDAAMLIINKNNVKWTKK